MPEVLEVELTRRAAAGLIGRRLVSVERTDPLVVEEGVDVLVPGSLVTDIARRGKQLVLCTDGPAVGVHFGMTGRLVIEDDAAIERLVYGSRTNNPVWDRWAVRLDDARLMRVNDPRRLARVRLDPDLSRLGPDALTLRRAELAAALARRAAPVKAVLLDQAAIAGLGNLLVDEVLWWASIDPRRPARSLTADETAALHTAIRRRLPVMMRRGGSHTGKMSRVGDRRCTRDGAELARVSVGGRTTVFCPYHQR